MMESKIIYDDLIITMSYERSGGHVCDACKNDILKMQEIFRIEETGKFFVHNYIIHRSCMNDFLIKFKNK
jgi:hypothetical protein